MRTLIYSLSIFLFTNTLTAQRVIWKEKSHWAKRGTYSVSFSADGTKVLSSSQCTEAQIRVWDASSGQLQWTYQVDSSILCLHTAKFSSNTNYFATADERGKLLVFDNTGAIPQLRNNINTEGRGSYSVDFSHDNKQFVLDGLDGNIRIYDIDSSKVVKTLIGHTGAVTTLDWSPNGKFIVSGGKDSILKIWDPNTGKCINTISTLWQQIVNVKITTDNSKILVVLASGQLRVFEKADYLAHLKTIYLPIDMHQIDVSYDNKYLAVATVSGVLLYELESGRLLENFNVPEGGITYTLAFSPNSYNLVMGSENGDVALWSLSTLITGTKEVAAQKSKALFYPNPANDFIHFNSLEPIQEVRIYSITGQILVHQQNAAPIDISQLTNGMYFVQINNATWQQLHVVH